MTSAEPDLPSVLRSLASAWPTRLLLITFALAELVNIGVLPSLLETMKTKTSIAQVVTAEATAAVAKLRQDAEAAVAAEDARSKAEIARYAERLKQAIARKTTAEAKRSREIALNSPDMQAAEAKIQQQKAAIAEEKAQHEARYRQAEAAKTAAEAILSDVEGSIQKATQRANLIKERTKALLTCTGSADLNYQRTRGGGTQTSPCSFFAGNYEACKFRWNRSNCLDRLQ